MEKKVSNKSRVIIALAVLIAIVAIVIGGIVLYNNNSFRHLNYNHQLGDVAVEKVENAQYTPDIDKYFELNKIQQEAQASATSVVSQSTSEEFTALIDEYATVYNYAGAGKYLGYDIYEIKEEIKFIVEKVPAFNQWFRMPTMREEEGFASIPYYENWAYYLEMDKDSGMLSVTRVCWSTSSSYYDFEKGKEVEVYADRSRFIQYEIMKTNYLETATDEIVECFIYSVGIDNVKYGQSYNENVNDYHPFEFQYLRNVKDKSMVKYHITVAERRNKGMDIRGLYPYGKRREFTIVNYDGYKDIDVTKIDQKLGNDKEDSIVDFDVNDNNIRILLDAIGFDGYYSHLTQEEFLDAISKEIIDNFELKNNWAKIYREQNDTIEVDTIYGPFYGKDLWLTDVDTYVSCRGHNQEEVEFYADGNIYLMSKFDLQKEYSLSIALKSRETGKLTIIATDYNKIEKVYYYGSITEFYYRMSSSCDVLSDCIRVDEDGVYDVVSVLTVREDDEDVILFDTLQVGLLRSYYGLVIPDSVDSNGVTHKYTVKGTGKKLTITVSSVR